MGVYEIQPARAKLDKAYDEAPFCQDDTPELDAVHAENEANAQFIVTACNAHYELLEAAKDELAALEIWLRGQVEDDIFDGMQISRNKLKAAIAKAEGKEQP